MSLGTPSLKCKNGSECGIGMDCPGVKFAAFISFINFCVLCFLLKKFFYFNVPCRTSPICCSWISHGAVIELNFVLIKLITKEDSLTKLGWFIDGGDINFSTKKQKEEEEKKRVLKVWASKIFINNHKGRQNLAHFW